MEHCLKFGVEESRDGHHRVIILYTNDKGRQECFRGPWETLEEAYERLLRSQKTSVDVVDTLGGLNAKWQSLVN